MSTDGQSAALSLSPDHYGAINAKDRREGGACFSAAASPFADRTFLTHLAVLTVPTIACIILFATGQNGNEWGIDLLVSGLTIPSLAPIH